MERETGQTIWDVQNWYLKNVAAIDNERTQKQKLQTKKAHEVSFLILKIVFYKISFFRKFWTYDLE